MSTLTVKGIRCLSIALLCAIACLSPNAGYSQNSNVSIGTESLKDRAILWLKGNGNQGLLLPVVSNRSTFTGLNNSDDKGMLIFDSSDNKIYYWNGTIWIEAGGGGGGSNQTLSLNGNTFTLSGSPASSANLSAAAPTTGQALIWNATAWTAASAAGDVSGPNSATVVSGIKGQALPATLPATTNALVYTGTSWAFQPVSSSGEANTASNVGTAGVGVFKQKNGLDLEFQKINAGSNRISVTLDATNSEVDIDVNQANLAIASSQITGLGALAALSVITSAQITDGTIVNADISPSAAITVNKLAPGTNGQVLTVSGGVPVWSTPAGAGTVTSVGTGTGLTGGPITGTGTISIAAGGVTINELANNAVNSAKIVDASITGADIAASTITTDKLVPGTNGQVLTVSGGVPVWSTPAGAGTVTNVATGTGLTGGPITGTGTISIAAGGVTVTELANNAVTSAKILDGTITGTDIAAATITADRLAASGATANQVLQYNGTNWTPVTLPAGGTVTSVGTGTGLTGGPITGTGTISIAAGGVTATELATNAVTNIKVADNAITTAKIQDATITGADIANTTITANKLAQSGATPNQVLHWDGTNWVPVTPTSGTVTSVAAGTGLTGGPITTTGTLSIATGGVTATELATNAVTNIKVADNAITTAKIQDATITGADIANTTITANKLAQSGAANNQVLQWNGTNWVPVTLAAGWNLSGNAGTNPTTNFIGTTDDQPLEVRVNNTPVVRYELNMAPTTAGTPSPNIIAGYSGNSATAGVKGSVIAGGGLENANIVDGDWAVISGGRDNRAGRMAPYSAYSTVGGGASNASLGQWSSVGGGKNNTANASGSAIPGGIRLITGAYGSTVVGTANVDPSALGYSTNTWVATDPVFIVGNGQVANDGSVVTRSNALTILKNGNVGIGRDPSARALEVEGDASKTTAGTWVANSDRRIKTDILDIENSFDLLRKLRPVKFKYTPEWRERHPSIEDRYYYNFIAQEYAEVFPESVNSSGETLPGTTDEVLQIDTYNAQIATIKAVQELIEKVEKLEAENKQLKADNNQLESKLTSFEQQLEEIKRLIGATASEVKPATKE